MSSDPPELGKGLFGYRKSAVNQILSDRDLMLRQAEGRVRSAESKVGELEKELNQMRVRNTRMDEQLERLRSQLDALTRRAEGSFPAADASTAWEGEPDQGPGYPAEPAKPSEDDLSYGLEMPGGEQAEAETYADYGTEAPEAGVEYEAAAAAPESFWSGEPTSEVHMETGPDYAEPAPGIDLGEAEAPGGEAPGYEPPQFTYGGEQAIAEPEGFTYGGEQAIAEPEGFTYGGEQAVSQPEEYEDEMDALSYGAELASPFEPPAVTEEVEEEAPAPFESGMPDAYEPSEVQAMEEETPAEYRPAGYEIAAVQPEPTQPPRPSEPARPSAASEASETTSRRLVTEEIAGVLSAAEESAARILERARVQSEQQISKSSKLWEEVRAEVSRLGSWRQGIEPVIQTVMTKVEGIRSQIEDVPERIREALAPMADSISGIDSDLAELAEACSPPLLLAPSELEPDEGEGDLGWDGSEGREDHPSGRRNAG